MGFSRKDFERFQLEIKKRKEAEQIVLPPDEYAKVMSEFNTHMSDEDRNKRIVTKAIGDYYYTIINRGFDDYTIIGKHPIIDDIETYWEDIK